MKLFLIYFYILLIIIKTEICVNNMRICIYIYIYVFKMNLIKEINKRNNLRKMNLIERFFKIRLSFIYYNY